MNNNLENFKAFAKSNPTFANYIKDGSMTWQKFYELYDMYGEDNEIWNEYKEEKKKSPTLNDIVKMAKNIDVDKLQTGMNSLSKALALFSDLFAGNSKTPTDTYKPRAIYRRFED